MECVQFIGKDGIRNAIARSRFEAILRNLHLSDNTNDDKSDKDYKVRSLINRFNQILSNSISYDNFQSISKHIVKLKS